LDAQSSIYQLFTTTSSSICVFNIDKCFNGIQVFNIDDFNGMPAQSRELKNEQVKKQSGALLMKHFKSLTGQQRISDSSTQDIRSITASNTRILCVQTALLNQLLSLMRAR